MNIFQIQIWLSEKKIDSITKDACTHSAFISFCFVFFFKCQLNYFDRWRIWTLNLLCLQTEINGMKARPGGLSRWDQLIINIARHGSGTREDHWNVDRVHHSARSLN